MEKVGSYTKLIVPFLFFIIYLLWTIGMLILFVVNAYTVAPGF